MRDTLCAVASRLDRCGTAAQILSGPPTKKRTRLKPARRTDCRELYCHPKPQDFGNPGGRQRDRECASTMAALSWSTVYTITTCPTNTEKTFNRRLGIRRPPRPG